jgi:hypothetical protein
VLQVPPRAVPQRLVAVISLFIRKVRFCAAALTMRLLAFTNAAQALKFFRTSCLDLVISAPPTRARLSNRNDC